MLRFVGITCAVLLLSQPTSGQQPKQPYELPKPKGWLSEVIALPPGFAPDMKWKGHEDLRFAPGMYKADAEDFFSYTILFWLPGQQKVDAPTLESELLAYYRGLFKAVSKSKNKNVEAGTFTLTVKDKTPDKIDKRPTGEAAASFLAELKWIEPFVTGKSQTLRMEVTSWYCEKAKHQCVFISVSPQPTTAAVWKTMHDIQAKFTCHNP